jgi:hypothetical protein
MVTNALTKESMSDELRAALNFKNELRNRTLAPAVAGGIASARIGNPTILTLTQHSS